MERDVFEELSAGHALNALSGADETAFQRELLAHPEWAHLARRDEETAAVLAGAVVDTAPPPGMLAALLARIGEEAQDDPDDVLPALLDAGRGSAGPLPTETLQTVARRGWTRGILALAASLVLLAAVGFGSAVLGGRLFPQDPQVVALEQIERSGDAKTATVDVAGGGEATAYWSASLGQAVLVTDGVAALDDAQTYELWLVRGDRTIAAGLFDVAAGGQSTSILDAALQPGDAIAVSVEPSGGSLGDSPSTTPIVVIATQSA